MKLPFVDALESVVLGRTVRPFPPPFLSMKHGEKPPQFNSDPDWVDYETRCILGYRQTAPVNAAEQVRRDAIRALTYQLYGGVRKELVELSIELRGAGLYPDSEPMVRLEKLIETLSP